MLLSFTTVVNTTLILLNIRQNFKGPDYNENFALLVPYSGAHYDENVADCDARIKYVSGFSGSAGSVIITSNEALLWTDGRYHLQADLELDDNWTLMKQGNLNVPSQAEWLLENFNSTATVYVDAKTITFDAWSKLSAQLATKNIELKATTGNIVDTVWEAETDDSKKRPDCPKNKIVDLPVSFSGRDFTSKLDEIREIMDAEDVQLLLVSELDEIAWLFNLRGSDFDKTGIFLSYAIIHKDSFQLFINNPDDLETSIEKRLTDANGFVFDYEIAGNTLKTEAAKVTKVWLSKYANAEMVEQVEETQRLIKLSPVITPKSLKNPTEVNGMKAAHLRDSAAIVTYFSWLTSRINSDGWQNITEISGPKKLYEIRKNGTNFVSESFTTISGFGSNGAIIHYRPTEATDRQINGTSLYLLDSGGLYKDGTTDITRTIHLGDPTDEQKDRYTRVLKGHVTIATAKFPEKSPGYRMDTLARKALWDIGLDYQHGTGHGIGHYLNVHEGPQSFGNSENDPGLQINMFISNEPGFYKNGDYGIRIENIVRVHNETGYEGYLGFETVSFVPFDRNLIDVKLLTTEELAWINTYHKDCQTKLTEFLNTVDYIDEKEDVVSWLNAATKELTKDGDSSASVLNTNIYIMLASVLVKLYSL